MGMLACACCRARVSHRYVDAGALGIIVPNIYGVVDARRAVNSLKFKTPEFPNGTRRVGIGRATGYSECVGMCAGVFSLCVVHCHA